MSRSLQTINNVQQFDVGYNVVLLEEFMKDLPTLEENNLYVLHLQGSHGPAYHKRYPENFRRFTLTCDTNELSKCTQKQIHIPSIAHHNNATLNNLLKQYNNFKFSHDNLAHSMLGFFDIESPLYNEPYNIFGDSLKPNP